MATYSAIIDSGLTSAEGFNKALSQLLGNEGIPTITTPSALQVVQRGAGANMSVDVSIGSSLISNSTATFGYAAWQDAVSNVTISAANPSNPRIDAIVAYINLAAVSTTNNNNPGSLVLAAIAGTPAGSPSTPSDSTIQSTLGAGVPWVRLANVTVPANATQIVTANIADARAPFAVRANLWGGSSNTNGHTVPNVADGNVVIDNATQTLTNKTLTGPVMTSPSESGNTGWQTPVNGVTFTYSANNGNKEFVLTPSADPTSWLNPGMKMKFIRGTTPPTQAMSFTAASSQYATKASPTGITFTSAFTAETWIYLNSYTGNNQFLTGRLDAAGTSGGWRFIVNGNGQLDIGYGSGSSFTTFVSYQSVPLKRWVHVAGVVTSTSSKTGAVYINGMSVPVSSPAAAATSLTQASVDLRLGAASATSSNTYLDGYIAEARVWSVAQSQAAIQANMGINLTGSETNLVALFQGPTFNDLTSNGNNLTATNGATQVTAYPYNATEYCFVTKVASGAVTVFCGTDYGIPNMTLNSAAYSTSRAPFGFPAGRNKWLVDTIKRAAETISTGTSGTFVGSNHSLSVPTGSWRIWHEGPYAQHNTSSGNFEFRFRLSGATAGAIDDSQTDSFLYTAGGDYATQSYRDTVLELSAQEVYTLQSAAIIGGGTTSTAIRGDVATSIIRAECAYI